MPFIASTTRCRNASMAFGPLFHGHVAHRFVAHRAFDRRGIGRQCRVDHFRSPSCSALAGPTGGSPCAHRTRVQDGLHRIVAFAAYVDQLDFSADPRRRRSAAEPETIGKSRHSRGPRGQSGTRTLPRKRTPSAVPIWAGSRGK